MNVRILGYFSLGAMILCGLVLVLTFKWIETALASGGQISIWGLVRWYVVLIVLFSPWLYFTLANRLKVQGDRIVWGIYPFQRRFGVRDISAIEAAPNDDGPSRAFKVHYMAEGERRVSILAKGEFPDSQVKAFVAALKAQRPDLAIPDVV